MINSYKEKLTEATAQYQKLNKQYNQIGLLRLVAMLLIIGLVYQLIKAPSILMGLFCILAIIVFFLLIVKHKKISARRTIAKPKYASMSRKLLF